VVQEAGNTWVNMVTIRQPFKFWVEKPAQLENRWKAILNDRERSAGLGRTAPGEIEKYLSIVHFHPSCKIMSFGQV
jgi:hypothetical protein